MEAESDHEAGNAITLLDAGRLRVRGACGLWFTTIIIAVAVIAFAYAFCLALDWAQDREARQLAAATDCPECHQRTLTSDDDSFWMDTASPGAYFLHCSACKKSFRFMKDGRLDERPGGAS
jgi:hypothetical protein